MSVKADWGLADLDVPLHDDSDPLEGCVTELGQVIDLTTPEPKLIEELFNLERKTAVARHSWNAECDLMHSSGHDCSTRCPLYTDDLLNNRRRLCEIGVRMYEISASLEARQHGATA